MLSEGSVWYRAPLRFHLSLGKCSNSNNANRKKSSSSVMIIKTVLIIVSNNNSNKNSSNHTNNRCFLESRRNQGGLVGVVPKADDKLLEAVQEEAGATVPLKRLRSSHRVI